MIKVENLTRKFGAITAVDSINFRVAIGDVVGFLGPNGAGKSTTMRMIAGYLTPSSGKVIIADKEMGCEQPDVKAYIGYLPETAPGYNDMTSIDFLMFVGRLKGLTGKKLHSEVERVVEACALQNVRKQNFETLSKGYRRRVCLAQALLANPPILVLDEPTDGLDPNQKHEIREMIRDISKNKAIVISTHILEEVDCLCNRTIIISNGKIVHDGTPHMLRCRGVGNMARLCVAGECPVDFLDELKKCGAINLHVTTEKMPPVSTFIMDIANARESSKFVSEVGELLKRVKLELISLAVFQDSLDNVFRKLTIGKKD